MDRALLSSMLWRDGVEIIYRQLRPTAKALYVREPGIGPILVIDAACEPETERHILSAALSFHLAKRQPRTRAVVD